MYVARGFFVGVVFMGIMVAVWNLIVNVGSSKETNGKYTDSSITDNYPADSQHSNERDKQSLLESLQINLFILIILMVTAFTIGIYKYFNNGKDSSTLFNKTEHIEANNSKAKRLYREYIGHLNDGVIIKKTDDPTNTSYNLTDYYSADVFHKRELFYGFPLYIRKERVNNIFEISENEEYEITVEDYPRIWSGTKLKMNYDRLLHLHPDALIRKVDPFDLHSEFNTINAIIDSLLQVPTTDIDIIKGINAFINIVDQPKKSLDYFKRNKKLNKDKNVYLALYADALFRNNEIDSAGKMATKIIKEDKNNAIALTVLAKIQAKNQSWEQAAQYAKSAVDIDATYGEAYLVLSQYYYIFNKDHDWAESLYKKGADALGFDYSPLLDELKDLSDYRRCL